MAIKFHKSINLGGGVKLNVNKGSIGVSVGGKHGRVSMNTKGQVTQSASLPGTGLSYRSTASLHKKALHENSRDDYDNDSLSDSFDDDHFEVTYNRFDYSILSRQEMFKALDIKIKCVDGLDDNHCVVCGKKKSLFVKLTPHGFCDECNHTVRKAILDNKKTVDTYVNAIYQFGVDNVGKSLIVLALNTIDKLEGVRPYAPFFTSSLDEQRQILEEALKLK
jgi:hypothetical protein